MKTITTLTKNQLRTDLPDIKPGTRIKIYEKIKEGDRERLTPFEGIVIAKKHGKGINATFVIRAVLGGVGVEKIFPLHSPKIAKIEVLEKTKVRRAKLYYLRQLSAKKTRKKLKSLAGLVVPPKEKVVERAEEVLEGEEVAGKETAEEIVKKTEEKQEVEDKKELKKEKAVEKERIGKKTSKKEK